MQQTIVNFAQLVAAPIFTGLSGTSLAVIAALGTDSTVTLDFLLAVVGLFVAAMIAGIGFVWRLSSAMAKQTQILETFSREIELARVDRGRLLAKDDALSQDVAVLKAKIN